LVHLDFRGKGIATGAARELLRLGFREVAPHRVWATCLPENPASERVLRKVGMRKEGFLLRNLKIHDMWKSSFLYAILADEWARAVAML
jgi:RimJ/RimL family protein N-acetyltransferase